MIQKVLIADLGNVAVRLVWEFKRAAVKTVTVYTKEDYRSPHNTDLHAMLTQLCNEPGVSRRIIPVDEPQDADSQLEPFQQPTIYFRSGRRENHPQRPLRRPGLSCPVADDLKQRLRSRAAVFFHRPLSGNPKKNCKKR